MTQTRAQLDKESYSLAIFWLFFCTPIGPANMCSISIWKGTHTIQRLSLMGTCTSLWPGVHIHVQVAHVHLVYMRILATNGSPSTCIYFLLKLIIVTQQTKCEERVYGKVAFLSSSSPPITEWRVILEGISLILANLRLF